MVFSGGARAFDSQNGLNLASLRNTELANESSSNDAAFVGNTPLLALLPTGGGEQVRHRERVFLDRAMFEIRALSIHPPYSVVKTLCDVARSSCRKNGPMPAVAPGVAGQLS